MGFGIIFSPTSFVALLTSAAILSPPLPHPSYIFLQTFHNHNLPLYLLVYLPLLSDSIRNVFISSICKSAICQSSGLPQNLSFLYAKKNISRISFSKRVFARGCLPKIISSLLPICPNLVLFTFLHFLHSNLKLFTLKQIPTFSPIGAECASTGKRSPPSSSAPTSSTSFNPMRMAQFPSSSIFGIPLPSSSSSPRHSSIQRTCLFPAFHLLLLLLLLVCLLSPPTAVFGQQSRQKCLSPEASKNCGACIAASPECAWCADTRLNTTQRCDTKWEFVDGGKCPDRQLFSPNTEIKVAPQHNLPLGSRRADGVTVIQLEPQQVEIRMKPGDIVEVPFRYLHKLPLSGYEVRDFTIQTSEFRSLGIDIEFSIDCNGERIIGRVCPGVRPEQKISFYAKVSLADCSRPQLAAVSVGIYGYNTVSAIFVTPLCGCECEQPRQHERRSPRCSYSGNLVCGSCQCDSGKGGERCECDLDKYGVSNADELVGLCREHNKAQICSGRGKCQCGQCQCQTDIVNGRYCECDNSNCPLSVNGRMCSGRGACQCGKCVCEHGYSGEDCACDDDPEPCTENGVTCFNNGLCECGKCSCYVGWTGAKCNIQAPLPEESTDASANNIEDDGITTTTALTTPDDSESDESESSESIEDGGPKSAELLPTHQDDGATQDAQTANQEMADSSHSNGSTILWPLLIAFSTLLALFLGFNHLEEAFTR